jgi:hypothetical protein
MDNKVLAKLHIPEEPKEVEAFDPYRFEMRKANRPAGGIGATWS